MRLFAALLLSMSAMLAQAPKSFVGTVAGFRPESAEVEIRPDQGEPVVAKFTPDTIARRIAPGSTDLKSATAIAVTDVARGDRVLVTLEPGSTNVMRIVVMSANDIAKRNEADRLEWQRRGVAGIVSARKDNRITVKTRTFTGEAEAVITVDDRTSFKRYAPDSVKFSDAKASTLADVAVGDQLRARGEKSADGLQVNAAEVVFGTFVIKAGAITAVNPETHAITVKELGSNKTLTVVFTADSQIKRMPAFPVGGMAGPGRGTMPSPAPPGTRPGPTATPGRGPGGFDINQMLEHMPGVKLEELTPGSTVVISSTKGAKADQLTAIMVLDHADMLIQMASMMSGAGRGGSGAGAMGASGFGAAGMSGMSGGDLGGLGGLGIGGMLSQ
jgi:hypothetical protein